MSTSRQQQPSKQQQQPPQQEPPFKQQEQTSNISNYYHYYSKANNISNSTNRSSTPSSSCSSPSKNSKLNHVKPNDPSKSISSPTEIQLKLNAHSNQQQHQPSKQQQQQLQAQKISDSSPLLSPSPPARNLTCSTWSTTPSTSSTIYLNHPGLDLPPNSSAPAKSRHNSIASHHNSTLHRETSSSNSNRRSSSNAAALRYQQHQAQARAHAHVHAQLAHAQAQQHHQTSSYQQHMSDLATYITQVFLPSVLPTPEEYQIKEQTRQHLEALADKVSKGAKLLPFGSIASGLALRNSDMDLCCLSDPGNKFENSQDNQNISTTTTDHIKAPLDEHGPTKATTLITNQTSSSCASASNDMDVLLQQQLDQQQEQKQKQEKEPNVKKARPTPAEMVMILGQVIQEETAFMVKMLPKARIPIIKLSLPPSLGQPFGLSCDIGFENRLALENTRLLLTYAMVDPRMRTIVLFLKVWSKRRRINDPYLGTLSSYGYVLMVIFYLVNGRKLAVLPNLQQLPPPRVTPPEELVYDGHDIYFFDDLDALPRFWVGMNQENVGELLIEFFRFFSSSFRYPHDVISVRTKGGLVSKESKGWMHDIIEEGKNGKGGYLKIDLNRLCIEDPFQTDYNVARTVTRDGLFTIRGEFMRAVRVLSTRTDRLDVMIRELCEERQEGVLMAPPSSTGRRKSVPNSRIPYSMNTLSREEEEDEDDLEEQLLLQQQEAFLSVEQQPSHPPLTTRLMQDHIYCQATSSMDARPRYPPESIASEPPPLDRDMDWNHESISNYLSHEMQQLQLQQQQQSSNPQYILHPTAHVPDPLQSSKSATSAQPSSVQHYFHRFFQTPGSDNPNPQPSTSDSLHKSNMNPSTFYYDTESIETVSLVGLTTIPKHSSRASRRETMGSEFSQEELGSNSRGIGQLRTNTTRYNSQSMNGDRAPRSTSHSTMNHRRRSEQPQSSNSTLNFAAPPIITSHSSVRGMPDFSSLPVPGPIRFGNFGTAEKLLKQKIENQQRILGRPIPGRYYPPVIGNSSTSTTVYQQDLSTRHADASSLPHDPISPERTSSKMFSTTELNADRLSQSEQPKSKQEHDQHRGQFFLTAVTDPSRRRSLSNGACSHTLSPLSFEQLAKLCISPQLTNNEDENRSHGVETPQPRLNKSPTYADHQSSPYQKMESNDTIQRQGSTSSSVRRAIDKFPSPLCVPSSAHLPRKIVFGDVEVSTETAKEVRTKALAAVLRTRRMGSWNNQQLRTRPEGVTLTTDHMMHNNVADIHRSDPPSLLPAKNTDISTGIIEEGANDVGKNKTNSSNTGSEFRDQKNRGDNSIVKCVGSTNNDVSSPSVPRCLNLEADLPSGTNFADTSTSSSRSGKSSHGSSNKTEEVASDKSGRRRRMRNKLNKKNDGDCSQENNKGSCSLGRHQNIGGSSNLIQVQNEERVKQTKKMRNTRGSINEKEGSEISSSSPIFSNSPNSEFVQIPHSSIEPTILSNTICTQPASPLIPKIAESISTPR